MGQKVNPHGLRVGVIKDWDSKWYAEKDFADYLVEDHKIRTYLKKTLYNANISKIEIERAADRVKVALYTAKPGVIIGKGGAGIEKIKADAPKVLFAETVQKAEGDILVRQLARLMNQRGYDIGERRLYEILRRDGWVIKANAKDQNAPTQKSVDMGLMRVIERTIGSAEKTFLSTTTVITPKGQLYFLNKYAPERPERKIPPVQEAITPC